MSCGSQEKKMLLGEENSQVQSMLLLRDPKRWSHTIGLSKIEHDSDFDKSRCKGMMGMKAGPRWLEERSGDKMETSADSLFPGVVSVTILARDLVIR